MKIATAPRTVTSIEPVNSETSLIRFLSQVLEVHLAVGVSRFQQSDE